MREHPARQPARDRACGCGRQPDQPDASAATGRGCWRRSVWSEVDEPARSRQPLRTAPGGRRRGRHADLRAAGVRRRRDVRPASPMDSSIRAGCFDQRHRSPACAMPRGEQGVLPRGARVAGRSITFESEKARSPTPSSTSAPTASPPRIGSRLPGRRPRRASPLPRGRARRRRHRQWPAGPAYYHPGYFGEELRRPGLGVRRGRARHGLGDTLYHLVADRVRLDRRAAGTRRRGGEEPSAPRSAPSSSRASSAAGGRARRCAFYRQAPLPGRELVLFGLGQHGGLGRIPLAAMRATPPLAGTLAVAGAELQLSPVQVELPPPLPLAARSRRCAGARSRRALRSDRPAAGRCAGLMPALAALGASMSGARVTLGARAVRARGRRRSGG